jgi:GTPase SAR1 family protein
VRADAAGRQWSEDVVPTVAFNFRKVRKGNVTLRIWDVAGQPKFRSMWERYCNGVDAVVCVSRPCSSLLPLITSLQICGGRCRRASHEMAGNDVLTRRCTQKDKFDTARFELQQLLAHPSLSAVPLLVLGNKNDLDGAASVTELIRAMYVLRGRGLFRMGRLMEGRRQLDKIQDRPVSVRACFYPSVASRAEASGVSIVLFGSFQPFSSAHPRSPPFLSRSAP